MTTIHTLHIKRDPTQGADSGFFLVHGQGTAPVEFKLEQIRTIGANNGYHHVPTDVTASVTATPMEDKFHVNFDHDIDGIEEHWLTLAVG